jgi:hypothetical protein
MDEATSTCDERFAVLCIPPTEATRQAWREPIISTLGLHDCISGAILYDQSLHQPTGRTPVSLSASSMPGSSSASRSISARILARRCRNAWMGCVPAWSSIPVWRQVAGLIGLEEVHPSGDCMLANVQALAMERKSARQIA